MTNPMSAWMFRRFMQGQTIDEIAANSKEPKPTRSEVRMSIMEEHEKFEDDCLKSVLSNARQGDVRAIDWLSQRGLFNSIKLGD